MRKLTYFVSHSIDGYIAAPDGAYEHLMPYQDVFHWMLAECPETLPAPVHTAMGTEPAPKRYDTVVMGRATYDPALEQGLLSPYPHLRQYVVTGSLSESPSPDVTLVAGDPVATVRALKAEEGGLGIWLAGGAALAGALLDEIDELVLKCYPVVAGAGIPLFRAGFRPVEFAFTGQQSFPDGGRIATYVRNR